MLPLQFDLCIRFSGMAKQRNNILHRQAPFLVPILSDRASLFCRNAQVHPYSQIAITKIPLPKWIRKWDFDHKVDHRHHRNIANPAEQSGSDSIHYWSKQCQIIYLVPQKLRVRVWEICRNCSNITTIC